MPVCINCFAYDIKTFLIARGAGFSLLSSSKLWNLCSNWFKSCWEGPRTTRWTSVADPQVRPNVHYQSQQRIFPPESIMYVLHVYIGVIIDLLMYMTCNMLPCTMNVEISWLHAYNAFFLFLKKAWREIIEYASIRWSYYWKKCVYIDEVHKNVIYIHLRARTQTTMHMKRDIILFYYSHSARFGLFNRPLCAGCSGRY